MRSGPGVEGAGTFCNVGGKQDCLGNASVLKGYVWGGVKFLLTLVQTICCRINRTWEVDYLTDGCSGLRVKMGSSTTPS